MATGIFVEGTELKQAATRTGQIINSMENIRNTIATIQNNKASTWLGQAAGRNASNFERLGGMLTSYLSDAHGTRQALDEAATVYITTEQNQVRQVQALSAEGIF